jgi:putative NADH-flavin reductase
MKLAIFGATGKTGQSLVEQALNTGYEVVAFARTPSKLSAQNRPALSILQGDILDVRKVDEAIAGVDAVLSALGPTPNQPEFSVSRGTQNILTAMQKQGVQRLVISAGAGVRDPQDQPKFIDHIFGFLLHALSREAVEDMTRAVALVRDSDRDWTVVRVPRLNDSAPSGKVRVGYLGPDVGMQLSRADMADFMLKQVNDQTYLCKAPVISN